MPRQLPAGAVDGQPRLMTGIGRLAYANGFGDKRILYVDGGMTKSAPLRYDEGIGEACEPSAI